MDKSITFSEEELSVLFVIIDSYLKIPENKEADPNSTAVLKANLESSRLKIAKALADEEEIPGPPIRERF